jgi:sterol desaturase/sphingolipid hydroxylase (fatty acid hydroxylase superfamily)
MIHSAFNVAGAGALVGLAVMLLFERARPLRRAVASKVRRLARNLGVGAVTAIAVQVLFIPIAALIGDAVETRKVGLLQMIPVAESIRLVLALLLLDYLLYWWHRLMHQVPFLWRFHMVHHTDVDLDVSTAARFHFSEWLLGTVARGAQFLVLGVGPLAVAVFEISVLVAAGFHHSNVRLPFGFERWLSVAIVTPRMHGIHHSIVERETNSNWTTILTVWDRMHGTLRLNVPQHEIVIGLPCYDDARELTLWTLLTLPFRRQRDTWLRRDGSRPERAEPPGPRPVLAA